MATRSQVGVESKHAAGTDAAAVDALCTELRLLAVGGRARTGLSPQGYTVLKAALTGEQQRRLREELTMAPVQGMPVAGPGGGAAAFPIFRESEHKLYLPKAYGLRKFGPPERCTLRDGEPMSPAVAFTGRLRQEQMEPVRAFLEAARDPGRMGGILSLPCGFGKTIAALHMMAELGRRTVVVVHKDFLLNQWRERIAQFLPAARVGTLKARVVDVRGCDIVIASLQSLSMKDYPPDIFEGFGTLVIDECHRVGTEVFSRALFRTNLRYSLGLSATVDRKDGMTKAFIAFLGDVLFKGARKKGEQVGVVQHRYHDPDPLYSREEVISGFNGPRGRPQPNISRMINNITAHAPRTEWVADAVMQVLALQPGRRVLVLSDRKSQLAALHALLNAVLGPGTAGFYWGGMKAADLAESEKRPVMCATFSYAAEGMDVPGLDTLVLASPKSDIEQSCGRILRQTADARARVPLILDVVDCFSLFERQAMKRRAFFKKHGYAFYPDIAAACSGGLAGCAGEAGDEDVHEDEHAHSAGHVELQFMA